MRLQAASGFLDHPPLIAAEFVQDDLRNNQLDLPRGNQILERTDDGLLAVILREIEPYTRVDKKVKHWVNSAASAITRPKSKRQTYL
jgi:hypothetical protein